MDRKDKANGYGRYNIVMELCMKDSDWRICSMGKEWKNGRMGRIIKESINMG